MRRSFLFGIILAISSLALLFVSCSENEPSTMPQISSSSSADLSSGEGDSSGGEGSSSSSVEESSSSEGSSSSVESGEDIEEDVSIPEISGLAVSRWVNPGELILRWDTPQWDPEQVTGVVMERDENYTGWVPVDTISGEQIRQGLWLDKSLDVDGQMKYRYRLYSIVAGDDGKSRRSPFTPIVGTMALDEWGFLTGAFDVPAGFSGCWVTGRLLDLSWSVRKMAQAGGWVLQALAHQDTVLLVDSTRAGEIEGFRPTDSVFVIRGTWIDLDTLSEDNNHYQIAWPSFVVFRLYAYYLDDFSEMTSEYSPEVNLSEWSKNCFSDRTNYLSSGLALDTAKYVDWKAPTHFFDCQQVMMNGSYYPPSCAAYPTLNCRMVFDGLNTAPCWDLGFQSMPWVDGMANVSTAYSVRGVVLDRSGDGIWGASPWWNK